MHSRATARLGMARAIQKRTPKPAEDPDAALDAALERLGNSIRERSPMIQPELPLDLETVERRKRIRDTK